MLTPGYLFALPYHAEDRLAILVLALCLDALVGDLPWLFAILPHPVVLVGKAIALFDRRLNRDNRSEAARKARGIVTLLIFVGIAGALGFGLSELAGRFRYGWVIELVAAAVLLAQRSLFDHVRRVTLALEKDGLAGGRAAVSHIVGRDPNSLDQYGVARAAIESLAENFSDGVVGPVLFYALAGLPGLFIYKTVNTLDSMIGYRSPRYLAFGWASARFDDLLNLAPARVSGVLVALAALFVPNSRPDRALRVMWRDARKHRSPNSGWPEAAMAGALGLALAGPRRYGDVIIGDPWLGDGRARAEPRDIRHALMIYVVAGLLQMLILGLLALAGAR